MAKKKTSSRRRKVENPQTLEDLTIPETIQVKLPRSFAVEKYNRAGIRFVRGIDYEFRTADLMEMVGDGKSKRGATALEQILRDYTLEVMGMQRLPERNPVAEAKTIRNPVKHARDIGTALNAEPGEYAEPDSEGDTPNPSGLPTIRETSELEGPLQG